MKFYNYITEKKWMKGTMLGFTIDPKSIKRISDYIESWLIKHKIDYTKPKHYHFTIAQIPKNYPKDELVRELNNLSNLDIKFNPKDLQLFQGLSTPKDYIVLEYKPNFKFLESFNSIASKFDIKKFAGIRPHTSIFIIDKNSIDQNLLKDIKFSMPKIPILKSKEVGLWNNKFEMETKI
jgi:hypothetical protein